MRQSYAKTTAEAELIKQYEFMYRIFRNARRRIGAANYDPRLHKDPHKFDVTREDIDHLAFGGGRRYCLGAPLARLEAQIGLETLLARFPNLRMPEQELVWKTVPGFRGLEKLIVEV